MDSANNNDGWSQVSQPKRQHKKKSQANSSWKKNPRNTQTQKSRNTQTQKKKNTYQIKKEKTEQLNEMVIHHTENFVRNWCGEDWTTIIDCIIDEIKRETLKKDFPIKGFIEDNTTNQSKDSFLEEKSSLQSNIEELKSEKKTFESKLRSSPRDKNYKSRIESLTEQIKQLEKKFYRCEQTIKKISEKEKLYVNRSEIILSIAQRFAQLIEPDFFEESIKLLKTYQTGICSKVAESRNNYGYFHKLTWPTKGFYNKEKILRLIRYVNNFESIFSENNYGENAIASLKLTNRIPKDDKLEILDTMLNFPEEKALSMVKQAIKSINFQEGDVNTLPNLMIWLVSEVNVPVIAKIFLEEVSLFVTPTTGKFNKPVHQMLTKFVEILFNENCISEHIQTLEHEKEMIQQQIKTLTKEHEKEKKPLQTSIKKIDLRIMSFNYLIEYYSANKTSKMEKVSKFLEILYDDSIATIKSLLRKCNLAKKEIHTLNNLSHLLGELNNKLLIFKKIGLKHKNMGNILVKFFETFFDILITESLDFDSCLFSDTFIKIISGIYAHGNITNTKLTKKLTKIISSRNFMLKSIFCDALKESETYKDVLPFIEESFGFSSSIQSNSSPKIVPKVVIEQTPKLNGELKELTKIIQANVFSDKFNKALFPYSSQQGKFIKALFIAIVSPVRGYNFDLYADVLEYFIEHVVQDLTPIKRSIFTPDFNRQIDDRMWDVPMNKFQRLRLNDIRMKFE